MPHPGRMTTQKAKDFKGTMRSLLAELGHYKFRLIAVNRFQFDQQTGFPFPGLHRLNHLPQCWNFSFDILTFGTKRQRLQLLRRQLFYFFIHTAQPRQSGIVINDRDAVGTELNVNFSIIGMRDRCLPHSFNRILNRIS